MSSCEGVVRLRGFFIGIITIPEHTNDCLRRTQGEDPSLELFCLCYIMLWKQECSMYCIVILKKPQKMQFNIGNLGFVFFFFKLFSKGATNNWRKTSTSTLLIKSIFTAKFFYFCPHEQCVKCAASNATIQYFGIWSTITKLESVTWKNLVIE